MFGVEHIDANAWIIRSTKFAWRVIVRFTSNHAPVNLIHFAYGLVVSGQTRKQWHKYCGVIISIEKSEYEIFNFEIVNN